MRTILLILFPVFGLILLATLLALYPIFRLRGYRADVEHRAGHDDSGEDDGEDEDEREQRRRLRDERETRIALRRRRVAAVGMGGIVRRGLAG
ncbi:hypothetical protein EDC01DRAFT_653753 [Geopyxis carbonaria]|nr:hypothetical protein EDC01DRAFT_653753 [Geopyxis carbonaria]